VWCILASLSPPQKHGALAALAAYERDVWVAHLPARSSVVGVSAVTQIVNDAFGAQLLNRFDHVIEPVDVRLTQQATVGLDRQIAVEPIVAFSHPTADLPLLNQTEILDVRHAHERERIIDLRDTDIPRSDARALIKQRRGIGPVGFPDACGLTLTAH